MEGIMGTRARPKTDVRAMGIMAKLIKIAWKCDNLKWKNRQLQIVTMAEKDKTACHGLLEGLCFATE